MAALPVQSVSLPMPAARVGQGRVDRARDARGLSCRFGKGCKVLSLGVFNTEQCTFLVPCGSGHQTPGFDLRQCNEDGAFPRTSWVAVRRSTSGSESRPTLSRGRVECEEKTKSIRMQVLETLLMLIYYN